MAVSFKIQLLEKMGVEDTFNSKADYVDLVNLVRSIQRLEGNIDCYRRGLQCERMNCAWREHCFTEAAGKLTDNMGSQEKKEISDTKEKEGG